MTLIKPDMTLRIPDISTTVETLNLISKMNAQRGNIPLVIAPEHNINTKILKTVKVKKRVLVEQMGNIARLLKLILKAQLKEIGLKSAMSEIDSIKDDLKKLIAKLHIIILVNKATNVQCIHN